MSYRITRRRMLKLIATTAAAALAPTFHARAHYPIPPEPGEEDEGADVWIRMGRAIHTLAFYDEPSTAAAQRLRRFCAVAAQDRHAGGQSQGLEGGLYPTHAIQTGREAVDDENTIGLFCHSMPPD